MMASASFVASSLRNQSHSLAPSLSVTPLAFSAPVSLSPIRFPSSSVNFRRPRSRLSTPCASADSSANSSADSSADSPKPTPFYLSRRSLITAAGVALFFPSSILAEPFVELPLSDAPAPASATTPASKRVSWGYVGEAGPEHWQDLSTDYSACGNASSQSPIALSYRSSLAPSSVASRPSIEMKVGRFVARCKAVTPGALNRSIVYDTYNPPPPPIVGDAPPVDLYRPSVAPAILTVPNAGTFRLASFHLHAPSSEHTVNDSRGLLEVHFVFQRVPGSGPMEKADLSAGEGQAGKENVQSSPSPSIAVVGVLFGRAEESCPFLKSIIDVATPVGSDFVDISEFPSAGRLVDLDVSQVIPPFDKTDLYSYTGSLTTPPGTQGVSWFVVGKRSNVSEDDALVLANAQGGANVRPLQDLGVRTVVRFPEIQVDGT